MFKRIGITLALSVLYLAVPEPVDRPDEVILCFFLKDNFYR